MIRLIKMELYRLFHAVSTYVMFAVVAGLSVLMSFTLKMDLDVMEKSAFGAEAGAESGTPAESFASGFADGWASEAGEPEVEGIAQSGMVSVTVNTETENVEGFALGFSSSADESWLSGDIDAGNLFISEVQSSMLVLLIAIFVPLFINAEQKKGYIKNIAGQIPGREMLALSKLPAVAVQILLLFAVFWVAHASASAIFFKGRLVFHTFGATVRALGVQYLIHAAWGCVLALLTMATRSTAFAMTTGILLASGVVDLLMSYVNRAIHALIPSVGQFDIRHYTLTYATNTMSIESTLRQIGGFLMIAAFYIVVSAVLAGVVYHKRDVR